MLQDLVCGPFWFTGDFRIFVQWDWPIKFPLLSGFCIKFILIRSAALFPFGGMGNMSFKKEATGEILASQRSHLGVSTGKGDYNEETAERCKQITLASSWSHRPGLRNSRNMLWHAFYMSLFSSFNCAIIIVLKMRKLSLKTTWTNLPKVTAACVQVKT